MEPSNKVLFKEQGKIQFRVLDAAAELHTKCGIPFGKIGTAFEIVARSCNVELVEDFNSEYACRIALLMRSDVIMFRLAKELADAWDICVSGSAA